MADSDELLDEEAIDLIEEYELDAVHLRDLLDDFAIGRIGQETLSEELDITMDQVTELLETIYDVEMTERAVEWRGKDDLKRAEEDD